MNSLWRCCSVLVLLLSLAGCTDGLDIFVVVHETNLPDEPANECAYSYATELTRECDGMYLYVRICATEALCQAQVDAIVDELTSCRQGEGPFDVSVLPDC